MNTRDVAIKKNRYLDSVFLMAVARRHGEANEYRLVWHYVATDQTRVSRRTPEQLEDLRRDTIALIDTIRAEEKFAPKVGPLCGWCEYRDRCPAYADEAPFLGAAAAPASRSVP